MYQSRKDCLSAVLSYLWALRIHYQDVHVKASGPNYYGDHLLFQRLYETVEVEIDATFEKLVGLEGPVHPGSQQAVEAAMLVRSWEAMQPDAVSRSREAERGFQDLLEECYDCIDGTGDMTLGLDDFIMAMASTHEIHEYLLERRLS